jgi:hypothetical protein
VHTGPFPVVAPRYEGQVWLWRIANASHFTAVIVKFGDSVLERDLDLLAARAREAVRTRGRTELDRCLRWDEPPREIVFEDPDADPEYWGGRPTADR